MATILPREIVEEEVLPKLPAKSLVRFSYVCKRWHSLISDSKFIRKQIDSFRRQKLVFVSNKNIFTFKSCEVDDDVSTSRRKFPVVAPLGVCIFGSVNGLLCLGCISPFNGKSFRFVLWNPVLNSYKNLPNSNFDSISDIELSLGIGFGYDSQVDDYKLVTVYRREKKSNLYSADIYLRKTNAWRTISLPLMQDVVNNYDFRRGICVAGFIYWIVIKSRVQVVLRFDLINENLKILELPPNAEAKVTIDLINVAGVFGVFQTSYNTERMWLWTTEEENGRTIWTTKMALDSNGLFPVCFLNKELIMRSAGGHNNVIIYSFDDKEKTHKKIESDYSNLGYVQRSSYIETLLSP